MPKPIDTKHEAGEKVECSISLEERRKYLKKLSQALLFQIPAFASLLSYIPRKAIEEKSHVAFTDGKVICLCNAFFVNYSAKEQGFIILHEAFHVVLRHVNRFKKFADRKDALLWNLVTDCIINYALGAGNDNVGSEFKGLSTPKNAFTFEALNEFLELEGDDQILFYQTKGDKCIDWSAEELFKKCKERISKHPEKEKIENKLEQTAQNQASSEGGSNGDPLKGKGELVGDMVEDDLGEGGREGDASEVDDLPDADSGRVGDMIWAKRIKAAAGSDPSGILKQLLGDLPIPKTDWKKQLRDLISSKLLPTPKTDWRRPSRRTLSGDIDYFMPNRGRERGVKSIVCFHDTSGSCWDDKTVKEFLSNIESIQKRMKADLVYITFDADVESVTHVPFDSVSLSKKIQDGKVNVKGGGGTRFQPCIDWLYKNPGADVAIMFTDTYAPMPSSKPKCPFIWAVVDNMEFDPPFGKKVCIEDKLF